MKSSVHGLTYRCRCNVVCWTFGFCALAPIFFLSSDFISGPAALICAETLRKESFSGKIVVLAEESNLPYDRYGIFGSCFRLTLFDHTFERFLDPSYQRCVREIGGSAIV